METACSLTFKIIHCGRLAESSKCGCKHISVVIRGYHQYTQNTKLIFFFLKQFIAIKINFIFLNCKVGDFQVVQLIALNEFLTMKTPFYVPNNHLNSSITEIEGFLVGGKGRLELKITEHIVTTWPRTPVTTRTFFYFSSLKSV